MRRVHLLLPTSFAALLRRRYDHVALAPVERCTKQETPSQSLSCGPDHESRPSPFEIRQLLRGQEGKPYLHKRLKNRHGCKRIPSELESDLLFVLIYRKDRIVLVLLDSEASRTVFDSPTLPWTAFFQRWYPFLARDAGEGPAGLGPIAKVVLDATSKKPITTITLVVGEEALVPKGLRDCMRVEFERDFSVTLSAKPTATGVLISKYNLPAWYQDQWFCKIVVPSVESRRLVRLLIEFRHNVILA